MRLFVAIVPPPAVLAELEDQTARLPAQWPALRWTGPESWHVTLAFLGEVGEQVLPDLGARLERAAGRHPELDLAVRGIGAFPSAARAQVLWAGLDGELAGLRALAASAAAGARRAGAPSPDEGRRFRPHLTLARLREPADLRPLTTELAELAAGRWTAARIQLIRSHQPGPARGSRPRYESLAQWPLAQPRKAAT